MPAIKHNVLATSTGHGFSRKLFAFLNPEILTRFAFLGQGVVYALAFAQFLTITVLLVSVHISVLLLVGTWLALIYTFTAIWRWAARELHYYWTDMTDFFTVIWRAFEEELARTASPRPWYRYPGDHEKKRPRRFRRNLPAPVQPFISYEDAIAELTCDMKTF